MNEADVARWYTDYGYIVFRRCLAYLGELTSAEDAVQEVFVRALHRVDTYRGEASPRTWLCRIADHLCIDILRRDRRRPLRSFEGLTEDEFAPLGAIVLADDRSLFFSVTRLMGTLDDDSRRLAVLYFLDELTQEEIADELGLSRRTVGKRLKALMDHSRAVLGEELRA